ncbi:MAG: hypothetical protein H6Q69_2383 [Firmicutes bacterium]|nr:hypothetical protein [Bacillota bacterium]MBP2659351.1 hypothetical protein [Bacillota bacterium]
MIYLKLIDGFLRIMQMIPSACMPDVPAPVWAKGGQKAPYLTPYKDMVSIFLEESPERDFLRQGTTYYTDN